MQPSVVVVGSYVKDLSFRCSRFPAAGETVLGTFSSGPGGKGSNQAVAAARAGVPVRFVGAVGNDGFADEAARFLASEGVDARLVRKPRLATATAAVLVSDGGENKIVVAAGACGALAPRDVPAPLIRGCRAVVCQGEANDRVNLHAFGLARRFGAATLLNPAPVSPGFDRRILGLTDILIPNETEFLLLSGRRATGTPAAIHAAARRLGVGVVILTRGKEGCLISTAEGFVSIPGHRVRAVDTTGAGDAFVGAFAAEYARRTDIVAAVHFGNAAAALSVTRPGTADSMPRLAETRRLLRSRSGARSS